MDEFKVGDIVIMTDKLHPVYNRVKNFYGKITDHGGSWGPVYHIIWYKEPECITKATIIANTFWASRITLYKELDPKESKRTPVERKCRKLWNNSKWVKANPHLAY